jgi:uncharacterized protein
MSYINSRRKLTTFVVALSLLAAWVPARAADYAPIDCSNASSPAQRTICRSYPLGQAEARMATMFGIVSRWSRWGGVAISTMRSGNG